MATLALLALVVIVAAPVVSAAKRTDRSGRERVCPGPSLSGAVTGTCGPLDSTGPRRMSDPGTLVEIVGHDGGLSASTALAWIRLDDTSLSAQFGTQPVRDGAHTQIEPSAPTVAATGVKIGARVMVRVRWARAKTSSGA